MSLRACQAHQWNVELAQQSRLHAPLEYPPYWQGVFPASLLR
jgi:hypothetical protein